MEWVLPVDRKPGDITRFYKDYFQGKEEFLRTKKISNLISSEHRHSDYTCNRVSSISSQARGIGFRLKNISLEQDAGRYRCWYNGIYIDDTPVVFIYGR